MSNLIKSSWVDVFMYKALLEGKMSKCDKVKVGAVIVSTKNKLLYRVECNNPITGNIHECVKNLPCTDIIHAEVSALIKYFRYVSSTSFYLYCTHEPCSYCAKLLIEAGCKGVVYQTSLQGSKSFGSGLGLFLENSIPVVKCA